MPASYFSENAKLNDKQKAEQAAKDALWEEEDERRKEEDALWEKIKALQKSIWKTFLVAVAGSLACHEANNGLAAKSMAALTRCSTKAIIRRRL